MTRPITTEIPSDAVEAWLADFRAVPPVPVRAGWWRVWDWVSGRRGG